MTHVGDAYQGLKHRQVDDTWLAIVYWGGYGIQILDLNVFDDEAAADAWISALTSTLPRGNPETATRGAEPIAAIAYPRQRTDDNRFSVPTGRAIEQDRVLSDIPRDPDRPRRPRRRT
jgi:hypothetical protein